MLAEFPRVGFLYKEIEKEEKAPWKTGVTFTRIVIDVQFEAADNKTKPFHLVCKTDQEQTLS